MSIALSPEGIDVAAAVVAESSQHGVVVIGLSTSETVGLVLQASITMLADAALSSGTESWCEGSVVQLATFFKQGWGSNHWDFTCHGSAWNGSLWTTLLLTTTVLKRLHRCPHVHHPMSWSVHWSRDLHLSVTFSPYADTFIFFDFFVVRFQLHVWGMGLGLWGFAVSSSQGGVNWEVSIFESKAILIILAWGNDQASWSSLAEQHELVRNK